MPTSTRRVCCGLYVAVLLAVNPCAASTPSAALRPSPPLCCWVNAGAGALRDGLAGGCVLAGGLVLALAPAWAVAVGLVGRSAAPLGADEVAALRAVESDADIVAALLPPQPSISVPASTVSSAAGSGVLDLTRGSFAAARAHPCRAGHSWRNARSGYDQLSVSSPTHAQSPEPPVRRSRREMARTAAMVVLAVLITLFAVLNVKEVEVDWIFGSNKVPLIVVIVISLLVGVLITHFAELRSRRRR